LRADCPDLIFDESSSDLDIQYEACNIETTEQKIKAIELK
jgi:hypothetical protein